MSTPDLVIELEEHGDAGRYVTRLDGGPEAEMTFRHLEGNRMAIDHTGVPPVYRGQGIAQKLVERGIADARANGVKIVPICSYVAAQFRRHPDWADVLAD